MKVENYTGQMKAPVLSPVGKAWAREKAKEMRGEGYTRTRSWVDALVRSGHLPLKRNKDSNIMEIDPVSGNKHLLAGCT